MTNEVFNIVVIRYWDSDGDGYEDIECDGTDCDYSDPDFILATQ